MAYLLAAGFLGLVALGVLLLAGGVIRLGLRLGAGPATCVGMGMTALLALLAGGIAWIALSTGMDPWQAWQAEFARSFSASLDVYRRLGWEEAELQRTAKLVRWLFVDAAPAWCVVVAGAVSFLSYLVLRRFSPDLPGSRVGLRPFSGWVIPEPVIWLLLATLGLLAAGSRLPGWAAPVTANLLVVLGNLYFLGGLAVAVFVFDKRRVPRAVQWLFLLAAGLLPMLAGVVVFFGIFDTWWDWRRIKTLK